MDFQRWLCQGLPFVDELGQIAYEKKYFPIIENNVKTSETSQRGPIVLTSPSDIEYMERNLSKLNEMISSLDKSASYTFEPSNSFLKKAVYQTLEKICPSPQYKISRNSNHCIVVEKLDPVHALSRAEIEKVENQRCFESNMGFRMIFNDLVQSKKPIIGHNCMFDLMFMMKWFDKPLDLQLDGFKKRLHELFPYIYDTKFIASSGLIHGKKNENTALEDLYNQMLDSNNKLGSSRLQFRILSSNTSSDSSEITVPINQFHTAGKFIIHMNH
jgi:hypothetical protein